MPFGERRGGDRGGWWRVAPGAGDLACGGQANAGGAAGDEHRPVPDPLVEVRRAGRGREGAGRQAGQHRLGVAERSGVSTGHGGVEAGVAGVTTGALQSPTVVAQKFPRLTGSFPGFCRTPSIFAGVKLRKA
jgi:hypothetical protein